MKRSARPAEGARISPGPDVRQDLLPPSPFGWHLSGGRIWSSSRRGRSSSPPPAQRLHELAEDGGFRFGPVDGAKLTLAKRLAPARNRCGSLNRSVGCLRSRRLHARRRGPRPRPQAGPCQPLRFPRGARRLTRRPRQARERSLPPGEIAAALATASSDETSREARWIAAPAAASGPAAAEAFPTSAAVLPGSVTAPPAA